MKTVEEHLKEISLTTWVNIPQVIEVFENHLKELESDYKAKLSEAMEIINADDKLMFHISLKHENERLVRANKELEATIQKYDDFFKRYGVGVSIPFNDWIDIIRPEGVSSEQDVKTVKEILIDYLNLHGYDGLYQPGECGCIKKDLMPCSADFTTCEPGYLRPCDCGEHDFHIGAEKPETILPMPGEET